MDKEQIIQLLTDLDINNDDDRDDVQGKISSHHLSTIVKVTDGASKICLIFKNDTPFVVKWSTRNNEAMREVGIYEQAKSERLEMFFPNTEFLATINSIAFVIQQKVDSSDYNLDRNTEIKYRRIGKTALDKTVIQMQKGFWKAGWDCRRKLSGTWAKMAIVIYGKRICKQLCKFIAKNHINDLHRSNLGFINNKPVILDFSGYEELGGN